MAALRKDPIELMERAVAEVFAPAVLWPRSRETGASTRGPFATGSAAPKADRVPAASRVLPTDVEAELLALRKENAELRRANEILKAASAFFARELDPRLPR